MNKLVIVGNGFDLAHGLPTSYKHFIDDFWNTICDNFEKEEFKSIVYINKEYSEFLNRSPINSFKDLIKNLKEYSEEYGYRYSENNLTCATETRKIKNKYKLVYAFKFENSFFKKLNNKFSTENWVDIENEYYKELKRIYKQESESKEDIIRLNTEFEQIKELFESYMITHVKSKIEYLLPPKIWEEFFDFFDMDFVNDNSNKGQKKFTNYLSEFSKKHQKAILDYQYNYKLFETDIGEGKRALDDVSRIISQIKFLNFNYTRTVSLYIQTLNQLHYSRSSEIRIHGELRNKKNEINFGFGDEMDDDYRLIENLDDNEYLKNFKSFKYSQNSNYKNLLDYIDSEEFQVFVMGHSCGLSDRTLLNTIFEHKNCLSIKVFYHQKDDGSDNFTEIVQNISRHFNNKKLMREKIVNKSLYKPLPQNNQLPEVY